MTNTPIDRPPAPGTVAIPELGVEGPAEPLPADDDTMEFPSYTDGEDDSE